MANFFLLVALMVGVVGCAFAADEDQKTADSAGNRHGHQNSDDGDEPISSTQNSGGSVEKEASTGSSTKGSDGSRSSTGTDDTSTSTPPELQKAIHELIEQAAMRQADPPHMFLHQQRAAQGGQHKQENAQEEAPPNPLRFVQTGPLGEGRPEKKGSVGNDPNGPFSRFLKLFREKNAKRSVPGANQNEGPFDMMGGDEGTPDDILKAMLQGAATGTGGSHPPFFRSGTSGGATNSRRHPPLPSYGPPSPTFVPHAQVDTAPWHPSLSHERRVTQEKLESYNDVLAVGVENVNTVLNSVDEALLLLYRPWDVQAPMYMAALNETLHPWSPWFHPTSLEEALIVTAEAEGKLGFDHTVESRLPVPLKHCLAFNKGFHSDHRGAGNSAALGIDTLQCEEPSSLLSRRPTGPEGGEHVESWTVPEDGERSTGAGGDRSEKQSGGDDSSQLEKRKAAFKKLSFDVSISGDHVVPVLDSIATPAVLYVKNSHYTFTQPRHVSELTSFLFRQSPRTLFAHNFYQLHSVLNAHEEVAVVFLLDCQRCGAANGLECAASSGLTSTQRRASHAIVRQIFKDTAFRERISVPLVIVDETQFLAPSSVDESDSRDGAGKKKNYGDETIVGATLVEDDDREPTCYGDILSRLRESPDTVKLYPTAAGKREQATAEGEGSLGEESFSTIAPVRLALFRKRFQGNLLESGLYDAVRSPVPLLHMEDEKQSFVRELLRKHSTPSPVEKAQPREDRKDPSASKSKLEEDESREGEGRGRENEDEDEGSERLSGDDVKTWLDLFGDELAAWLDQQGSAPYVRAVSPANLRQEWKRVLRQSASHRKVVLLLQPSGDEELSQQEGKQEEIDDLQKRARQQQYSRLTFDHEEECLASLRRASVYHRTHFPTWEGSSSRGPPLTSPSTEDHALSYWALNSDQHGIFSHTFLSELMGLNVNPHSRQRWTAEELLDFATTGSASKSGSPSSDNDGDHTKKCRYLLLDFLGPSELDITVLHTPPLHDAEKEGSALVAAPSTPDHFEAMRKFAVHQDLDWLQQRAATESISVGKSQERHSSLLSWLTICPLSASAAGQQEPRRKTQIPTFPDIRVRTVIQPYLGDEINDARDPDLRHRWTNALYDLPSACKVPLVPSSTSTSAKTKSPPHEHKSKDLESELIVFAHSPNCGLCARPLSVALPAVEHFLSAIGSRLKIVKYNPTVNKEVEREAGGEGPVASPAAFPTLLADIVTASGFPTLLFVNRTSVVRYEGLDWSTEGVLSFLASYTKEEFSSSSEPAVDVDEQQHHKEVDPAAINTVAANQFVKDSQLHRTRELLIYASDREIQQFHSDRNEDRIRRFRVGVESDDEDEGDEEEEEENTREANLARKGDGTHTSRSGEAQEDLETDEDIPEKMLPPDDKEDTSTPVIVEDEEESNPGSPPPLQRSSVEATQKQNAPKAKAGKLATGGRKLRAMLEEMLGKKMGRQSPQQQHAEGPPQTPHQVPSDQPEEEEKVIAREETTGALGTQREGSASPSEAMAMEREEEPPVAGAVEEPTPEVPTATNSDDDDDGTGQHIASRSDGGNGEEEEEEEASVGEEEPHEDSPTTFTTGAADEEEDTLP